MRLHNKVMVISLILVVSAKGSPSESTDEGNAATTSAATEIREGDDDEDDLSRKVGSTGNPSTTSRAASKTPGSPKVTTSTGKPSKTPKVTPTHGSSTKIMTSTEDTGDPSGPTTIGPSIRFLDQIIGLFKGLKAAAL